MKHTILVLMLVVTPLVDVFIYDLQDCQFEHLVAEKVRVYPKERVIQLWSHDENGYTSDSILIQEHQEFHIKEKGKVTIIRYDGQRVYSPKKGACK